MTALSCMNTEYQYFITKTIIIIMTYFISKMIMIMVIMMSFKNVSTYLITLYSRIWFQVYVTILSTKIGGNKRRP